MNAYFTKSVNGLTNPKDDVKKGWSGRRIGNEIIFYEKTVSTNDDVLRLGRDYNEGLVVVADSQTGGRGRHGRRWESPSGVNLYFTILLKPPFSPPRVNILPLMASIAVVKGIKGFTDILTTIKWPNDIMIGNKKLGGILMEMRTEKDKIEMIALGTGLNVNIDACMLPDGIRNIATSLKIESGREIDRSGLLMEILKELDLSYNEFLKENNKEIISEWLALNSTIGHEVVVQEIGGKEIRGIAKGIDDNGCLLIRLPSGMIEKVSAGDVTILY